MSRSLKNIGDDELPTLLPFNSNEVFTEIYNRYWDKLYYTAYKLLKNTAVAEEIVQDVFMLLWDKKQNLHIQSLEGYLAAMTRYAVYRYMAREKHKLDRQGDLKLELPRAIDIESRLQDKLLLEIITELSNKLPEKCRLVFIYNKLHDRPLKEVAEELGISQKTAEAHLTKALRTVRTELGSTFPVYLAVFATFFEE